VAVPRCPGAIDPGTDDPSEPGMFDSPAAFDRGRCGGGGRRLDSIDACGIWHMDLDFGDFGPAFASVRIDLVNRPGDGAEDLEGLLFGRTVSDVRLTGEDLFLRWAVTLDDGTQLVRALDACSVEEDGSISGQYASCF